MSETLDLADLYDRGIAALKAGQYDAAAENFGRAVEHSPAFVYAHNGLGLALAGLGRPVDALTSYEAAIRLNPFFASPYINRGIVLRELGHLDAALANLDKAIALQPENPNGHGNRGSVLTEMKQPQAAIASIERALALNPAYPHLPGVRLINKAQICDWSGLDEGIADVLARLARDEPATPPWPLLALADAPALQRKAAESWIAAKAPANPTLGPLPKYPRHERIRIGYFSADFYRHATAHLMTGLFEHHDKTKFEIITFAFGPVTGDDMQKRIMAASDRYIDVYQRVEREIAALSRELEIDIAVDLKGFTQNHRFGIFAHRAAPIQMNYLGYPSTLGAPYIDYIIGDEVVIRDPAFFVERVVTLPNSYQVNDRARKAADRTFTRAELGLPESGFVFCCFNNNFKILPAMFDVWMSILSKVAGSVLWLIEDNPTAAANLRRETERRGVDPARLIFAPRIVPEEHLARHAAADLFLDTLPYNAHTTASDALWMGLPLLTCPGEGFPARVAASLLKAVDAPELIAQDLAAYEAMAIALAEDPARLGAIREKLLRNRESSPLFDTALFTRNIEAAYSRMFEEYHAA